MTKKEDIWPLISRYLGNSMQGDDADKLEHWLNQSNENRRILHAADRIWKASEERSQDSLISELNLEKDWYRVASRISSEKAEEKREKVLHFRKLRKRHQLISGFLKVAALILVAFTSAFLTYQLAPQSAQLEEMPEPVFNEIVTNAAERANIELRDGSKVMLNAASKLTMSERVRYNKHEVWLEGQAYFDIKSNQSRQFFIKTEKAVIEVIGTSFDVKSYPEDENVVVVVRKGTVELHRMDDPENRLIINEGYMGEVSKSDGRLALEMVDDPSFYFGWMEGRLIFDNTPLAEVFRQIERWYDVRIKSELTEQELSGKKLSADLKTRSVQEVLNVIEMSMDIDITIDGDKVLVRI